MAGGFLVTPRVACTLVTVSYSTSTSEWQVSATIYSASNYQTKSPSSVNESKNYSKQKFQTKVIPIN